MATCLVFGGHSCWPPPIGEGHARICCFQTACQTAEKLRGTAQSFGHGMGEATSCQEFELHALGMFFGEHGLEFVRPVLRSVP